MIIVTVLREKLVHSETIRENQTIKSDQSDDIWQSGFRVQFSFTSVNDRKWMIITMFTEWMTSSHELQLRLTEFKVNWSPKPINDDKEQIVFSLFFCVFFFSLSLVDMLNPCVCRFVVVNQKEKYWANHSWRWASGESMVESFVSGGLQDEERKIIIIINKNHHNKNKDRKRQVRKEARGCFSSITPHWMLYFDNKITKITKSRSFFSINTQSIVPLLDLFSFCI